MSDACKTTYEEIKKDKKHRYVVFFIKDEKQIDVEYIGMFIKLNSFFFFFTYLCDANSFPNVDYSVV